MSLRRVFSSTQPLPEPEPKLPSDGAKFTAIDGKPARGCLGSDPYPSTIDGPMLVDLCYDDGDYHEGVTLSSVTIARTDSGLELSRDPSLGLMRVSSTWLRGNSVGIAEDPNPLCRPTMEDAHVVVDHFHDGAGIYMGVYDGHGGSDVAVLAAERLHEIVECHLAAGGIDSCIERAFTSSFQVFQEEVVKGNLEGGCTAAVGLIMECPELGGRACYSANVGDARVVICGEDKSAIRLSFDHKPTDPNERERIENLGGSVCYGRVQGCLAVSRALGDTTYAPYVSQKPAFRKMKLLPQHRFMVVACDGIFDVLEDEDCSGYLAELHAELLLTAPDLDGEALSGKLAQGLVDEAMIRGTTDNVTAMVAIL